MKFQMKEIDFLIQQARESEEFHKEGLLNASSVLRVPGETRNARKVLQQYIDTRGQMRQTRSQMTILDKAVAGYLQYCNEHVQRLQKLVESGDIDQAEAEREIRPLREHLKLLT